MVKTSAPVRFFPVEMNEAVGSTPKTAWVVITSHEHKPPDGSDRQKITVTAEDNRNASQ